MRAYAMSGKAANFGMISLKICLYEREKVAAVVAVIGVHIIYKCLEKCIL